jgi:hypothetical protein
VRRSGSNSRRLTCEPAQPSVSSDRNPVLYAGRADGSYLDIAGAATAKLEMDGNTQLLPTRDVLQAMTCETCMQQG